MSIELSGTNELIFDASVKVISEKGYENISMYDISTELEMKVSSIYNFYVNKDIILDQIYVYYMEHINDGKKTIEEMQMVIRTCTERELVDAIFSNSFMKKDLKMATRLVLITKIIYSRIFNDGRANDIFLNEMTQKNILYIKEVLDYGVEIGRLKPFDTYSYASFYIGQLQIMGIRAFASLNYELKRLDEEENIMQMLTSMLEFN